MKIDVDKLNDISKELARELTPHREGFFPFRRGVQYKLAETACKGFISQPWAYARQKTKTGFSTDVSVLEELAMSHELPREILNWRSLSKLKATYVDALPVLINPKTGRVHTSFNQTATATGEAEQQQPEYAEHTYQRRMGQENQGNVYSRQGQSPCCPLITRR